MPLWKNKAIHLSESEVRYAMANSKSNIDAARFLRISKNTYRRYANMYTDIDTGLTLFQLHSAQSKKNKAPREKTKKHTPTMLMKILSGERDRFDRAVFKESLFSEAIKEEKCESCGFEERRVSDYRVPLVLTFIDGNKNNPRVENIKVVCLNCYFLTVDEINISSHGTLKINGY